jgi:hypothetical protein
LDVTASVFESLVASVRAFPDFDKIVSCFAQDDTDCYVGRSAIHVSPFAKTPTSEPGSEDVLVAAAVVAKVLWQSWRHAAS